MLPFSIVSPRLIKGPKDNASLLHLVDLNHISLPCSCGNLPCSCGNLLHNLKKKKNIAQAKMKTNTSSVVPSSRTPLPTTVMFSVSKALTTCNNYIGHNAYWCLFIPKCTYNFYLFQQSTFCSRNFTEQYKYMQIGCASLEFPNRGDRILLLYLELL